jgi:hypothetical protein
MSLYHLKQNFPTHDDACQHILDLMAVLERCATYFDNHSDVKDGPDGQPVPNEEMGLLSEIEKVL